MSCNGQFIVPAKQLKPPEKKKKFWELLLPLVEKVEGFYIRKS